MINVKEAKTKQAAAPGLKGGAAATTFRWYVVHVYSGFEKKVAASIREKADSKGLGDHFADILVPTQEVVEVSRGRKVNTEHKFFPGYVLVKMILNDDSWHMVKNIPKVTGFLGGGVRPVPMSDVEAGRLIKQMEDGMKNPKNTIHFEAGEQVRVVDGPFASFIGTVEEVDGEKSRLKVSVSIFGRATPVDLEFTQVEKI